MYVVATLFGSETPDSLLNSPRLEATLDHIFDLNAWYSKPLRYSAYVSGPKGKNVGTGGKKLVPAKLLSELQAYMAAGYFHNLECFESDAAKQSRDPEFFVQIRKNWRYDRELGYVPNNTGGNGITVTLAIAESLLTKNEDADFLLSHALQLFSLMHGTVGWIEVGSPWGRSRPGSRLQGYLIDYRYRDIPSVHYRFGAVDGRESDMRSQLALLEWGILLGPGHLEKLGGPEEVARLEGFLHTREIDNERFLVSASPEMKPLRDEDREPMRLALNVLLADGFRWGPETPPV